MLTVIKRASFLTTVAAVVCFTSVVYADEGSAKKEEKPVPAGVIHADVEGKNFCLGCALKKKKGAAAQCSLFGHKHSLRVTRATGEDGKELADLRGWVLHYLENEKSQTLIKGHHGENVKLMGIVYPQERVFEVSSMTKGGK